MKTKLIFDTENPDDNQKLKRCLKADDLTFLLFELARNSRKHMINNTDNEDCISGMEIVFDRINELMEEHNINLDELL